SSATLLPLRPADSRSSFLCQAAASGTDRYDVLPLPKYVTVKPSQSTTSGWMPLYLSFTYSRFSSRSVANGVFRRVGMMFLLSFHTRVAKVTDVADPAYCYSLNSLPYFTS